MEWFGGRAVERHVIYVDNHATTRLDPRVLERMMPYLTDDYGNASSRNHVLGWKAEEAVEVARGHVAQLIGATPREVVFTSGATESNNLAIFGVAEALSGRGRHLVTQATEHKAVLDVMAVLEARGFEITVLDVDQRGQVDPRDVQKAVRRDTILVSVMLANNEIGTIQRLSEIGEVCHNAGVYLHSDATQGIGKIPFDVSTALADLVSFSAHKMYGPKGAGALYVRRRDPRVSISAMIFGGGHERGLRSGTLNVPAIVGFGEASRIAALERDNEAVRVGGLRDRLQAQLTAALPKVLVLGHPTERLPGNLNIVIPGASAEELMLAMPDVAVSSGAACASAQRLPSHVLRAIGVPPEVAQGSLRFGIGRFNTLDEMMKLAERVLAAPGEAGVISGASAVVAPRLH